MCEASDYALLLLCVLKLNILFTFVLNLLCIKKIINCLKFNTRLFCQYLLILKTTRTSAGPKFCKVQDKIVFYFDINFFLLLFYNLEIDI